MTATNKKENPFDMLLQERLQVCVGHSHVILYYLFMWLMNVSFIIYTVYTSDNFLLFILYFHSPLLNRRWGSAKANGEIIVFKFCIALTVFALWPITKVPVFIYCSTVHHGKHIQKNLRKTSIQLCFPCFLHSYPTLLSLSFIVALFFRI